MTNYFSQIKYLGFVILTSKVDWLTAISLVIKLEKKCNTLKSVAKYS